MQMIVKGLMYVAIGIAVMGGVGVENLRPIGYLLFVMGITELCSLVCTKIWES